MKWIKFLLLIVKECKNDYVLSLANELTYKLLLAFFPFLIFFMSLIGFFNINGYEVLTYWDNVFPDEIMKVLEVFIEEVVIKRSPSILSSSLMVAIFSASSGFNAVIRGLNRAYGVRESRSFIKVRTISIILVLFFALSIVVSIGLLLFGDLLVKWIQKLNIMPIQLDFVFTLVQYSIAMVVLISTVVGIYLFASSKRTHIKAVLPGATVCVILWVVVSKIFSIYINNFSRFAVVYGSLASVFVLMFWLNMISFILLLGGEINAILEDYREGFHV